MPPFTPPQGDWSLFGDPRLAFASVVVTLPRPAV